MTLTEKNISSKEKKVKIITGNHAAAYALRQAKRLWNKEFSIL